MQCWIFQQKSLFYGKQTLWIADEIMRVDYTDIGVVTILHKVSVIYLGAAVLAIVIALAVLVIRTRRISSKH